MSFNAHHTSPLFAPSAPITLRALAVAGALLVCRSELAAQGSTEWLADADPASPARYDGRAFGEPLGVGYRVRASSGRADVGIGIGTLAYLVPAGDGRTDGRPARAQALVGAVPAITLGLRYRLSADHALFADAARVRGLGAHAAAIDYGVEVGVQWRPAKPTFGLEHGALGLQMASGSKLSLKLRRGDPSLHLRSQF
jgi:hypothetical protein